MNAPSPRLAAPPPAAAGTRSSEPREIEELICAALRGESPEWPASWEEDRVEAFLAASGYHGIEPLLHQRLEHSAWPAALLHRFRQDARVRAMWELRHRQVISEALDALSAAGAEPVLFKGTALAYSLYSSAVLRTRGDTDLLVPPAARAAAHDALASLGFVPELGAGGEFASHQASYAKTGPGGEPHVIDLHWRINNSNVLAHLFSHDELRGEAIEAPRLGPNAVVVSPVHALLLACMHRGTHRQNPYYVGGSAHYGGDRLVWLYDIHLLVETLDESQWTQVVRLATERGLRAVTVEALQQSRSCLGTALHAETIAALGRPGAPEAPARYLDGSLRLQQWLDFRAIPGARNKLRFVRELLFPPSAYVRKKYADARFDWLAWLYLRRVLEGMFKRMVPGRPQA